MKQDINNISKSLQEQTTIKTNKQQQDEYKKIMLNYFITKLQNDTTITELVNDDLYYMEQLEKVFIDELSQEDLHNKLYLPSYHNINNINDYISNNYYDILKIANNKKAFIDKVNKLSDEEIAKNYIKDVIKDLTTDGDYKTTFRMLKSEDAFNIIKKDLYHDKKIMLEEKTYIKLINQIKTLNSGIIEKQKEDSKKIKIPFIYKALGVTALISHVSKKWTK